MEQALVVRGQLSQGRQILLDERVPTVDGSVEVVVRSLAKSAPPQGPGILALIAQLKPASRSKADIDGQIEAERDAWGQS